MVAMLGWIIPEPLAIPVNQALFPPTLKGLAQTLEKVSVVRMASAASIPPLRESRKEACRTPERMTGIGNGTPIVPVEWVNTADFGSPKVLAVNCTVI